MKGGLGSRVIGWGVTLTLFFTVMVMLFGAPTTNSFGKAFFGALGDGIHVIVEGLPKMADHIKDNGSSSEASGPKTKKDTGGATAAADKGR